MAGKNAYVNKDIVCLVYTLLIILNGLFQLSNLGSVHFYMPERAYYVIPLGVRPSVCLSVRPSVRPLAIWFPEQNLSFIWSTMFKLHRMIVYSG
jgi:glucose-6-phosphate-specific signal transduction histidine kinase